MTKKISRKQLDVRFGLLARKALALLAETSDEDKLYYEMFLKGDSFIWEVFRRGNVKDEESMPLLRVRINSKTGDEEVELEPQNLVEFGQDF